MCSNNKDKKGEISGVSRDITTCNPHSHHSFRVVLLFTARDATLFLSFVHFVLLRQL